MKKKLAAVMVALMLVVPTAVSAMDIAASVSGDIGGAGTARTQVTVGAQEGPFQGKITLERMREKKTGEFSSGDVSISTHQSAIGVEGRKLIGGKKLQTVFVGLNASRASGNDFGNLRYYVTEDNIYYLRDNDRSFRGGRSMTLYGGLMVRIDERNRVRLALGGDRVIYDSESHNGVAAFARYETLILGGQLYLELERKEAYSAGAIGYRRMITDCLSAGVSYEKLDGRHGLPDDDKVFVGLTYTFGGGVCPGSGDNTDENRSLRDYVSEPAVKSRAVLAVMSESVVDVVKIFLEHLPAGTEVILESGMIFFPYADAETITAVTRDGAPDAGTFASITVRNGVRGVLVDTVNIPVSATPSQYRLAIRESDGTYGPDTGEVSVTAEKGSVVVTGAGKDMDNHVPPPPPPPKPKPKPAPVLDPEPPADTPPVYNPPEDDGGGGGGDDSPAEDPPAEDPPAEDPPAEDPPGGDGDELPPPCENCIPEF